jgi:hypothetical protein
MVAADRHAEASGTSGPVAPTYRRPITEQP